MTRTQQYGIDVTVLRSPDGATAVIADHGAHLLSWIPAGGEEALFLSQNSSYDEGAAIRGGVPIIFPQFSERGTGKRHGFARNVRWRLASTTVQDECAIARYELTGGDTENPTWPHRYALAYVVRISGQRIGLSLEVHNPSEICWEFCAAFHTYLRVDAVSAIGLSGLQHVAYIDQVMNGRQCIQTTPVLAIENELDRIYLDVPGSVRVFDSSRSIDVSQNGFRDTVVWNPGAEKGNAVADLTSGAYRTFVCVEAATVAQPIVLKAGAHWIGTQTLAMVADAA